MKTLATIFLFILLAPTWACTGNIPAFKIGRDAKVEAKAQTGLRIEGQNATPEVLEIKQISTKEQVTLKLKSPVTEIKDMRPFYKRMLGGSPDYRDVVIPNMIELRPEKIGEEALEYKVLLKEKQSTWKMYLIFRPGLSRCSG